MNIPSDVDCKRIIKYFDVPERIIKHSMFVWKLSEFVAGKFINKGIPINLKLLKAAAVLHDIDKMQTLNTGEHGLVAYRYLKDSYPEVASVVVSHVTARVHEYPPDTWEKKILFVCDKITQDDCVVLLEERIEYIRRRDGKIREEKIESFNRKFPINKKVEEEVFSQIGITPREVKRHFEHP